MNKIFNKYRFDIYFDDSEKSWFWAMLLNDELCKISKPYTTEEDAEKGLTNIQAELISKIKESK